MSDDGPSLFDMVDVPDIRTPPPSAPGSPSSEDAADCVSDPLRQRHHRAIMLHLAACAHPLSRAELAERMEVPVNVICPRVKELMPTWIESVPSCRVSLAKPNLLCDGLVLTPAGRSRVGSERQEDAA